MPYARINMVEFESREEMQSDYKSECKYENCISRNPFLRFCGNI